MGVEWEDVWEFPGQFYRGTVQSQGILYNPMGHRGLMRLRGSLMANLDMTDNSILYYAMLLYVCSILYYIMLCYYSTVS